jgi:hypothetical protein
VEQISLRVEGVKEVRDALDRLLAVGIQPSNKLRVKALSAAGAVIARAVRANLAARYKTTAKQKRLRALRNSKQGRKYAPIVKTVKRRFTREGVVIFVAKPTAHLLERGHRTRLGYRKPGRRDAPRVSRGKARVDGSSFFSRAVEANAQAAVDRLTEVLLKGLRELSE